MARWFRSRLSVARPFVDECLTSITMLRLHTPLIELDVQISRIQLSDKGSRCRPRDVAIAQSELNEPQLFMQVFVRISCVSLTPPFVLLTQPSAEPLPGMFGHSAVGVAYRTLAKVVRPTDQHPVDAAHLFLWVQPAPLPAGPLADLTADRPDLLRRRALANIPIARRRRVAAPEGLP